MNQEQRPVYPRLHFLELLPRFKKPTVSEGLRVVHEVNFKVQPLSTAHILPKLIQK